MPLSPLHLQTRRQFYRDCGVGLGKIALASLLAGGSGRPVRGEIDAASPFAPRPPHRPAKVKRVIYLFMAGAPSQLELFDYKPKLTELQGQPLPASLLEGQRFAFIQPTAGVLGPQFRFSRHGECGAELSEVLPHLAGVVDDIALVRSVHTDQFNHAPAQLFMNTGHALPGRPSLGAWLSYGIGSEADDLPSFVVLKSGDNLSGGAAMWGAGPLPSVHQGVPFRSQGEPILNAANPPGIDPQSQRESLDLIRELNARQLAEVGDPEIATRISAYEMAYRMQTAAPELMQLDGETPATLALYGADPAGGKASFANNCLLARRLAERGVRFIQVYHANWDHHSQVAAGVKARAREVDQPCAALIRDLQQRGLWDDTLIVWGGEFGRTPMVEASAALGRSQGRDHHPYAFTIWFAGGGIRGGASVGATDDLGLSIIDRPVHVHDVQATILHLLGIDHERLSVPFQGLNVRLTGVEPHAPIREIVA